MGLAPARNWRTAPRSPFMDTRTEVTATARPISSSRPVPGVGPDTTGVADT